MLGFDVTALFFLAWILPASSSVDLTATPGATGPEVRIEQNPTEICFKSVLILTTVSRSVALYFTTRTSFTTQWNVIAVVKGSGHYWLLLKK